MSEEKIGRRKFLEKSLINKLRIMVYALVKIWQRRLQVFCTGKNNH